MHNGISDSESYAALGVSATKEDVYAAIGGLPPTESNTFCRTLPDVLCGTADHLTLAHADGAGTKSVLAYLHHRISGSTRAYRGIAQDAVVMNLDDMVCAGATSNFVLTSIINRNATRIDGSVIREIVDATIAFTKRLREFDIRIAHAGGETADVGDVVRTLLVDATMTCQLARNEAIPCKIQPGLEIVGLESGGPPCEYETEWNSGIGCNGITSARHELLNSTVSSRFPEILEPSLPSDIAYRGQFAPEDILPGSEQSVLDALLSPTRTFAPVLRQVLHRHRRDIHAIVHCTGGGHTKCLRFAAPGTVIKKNLGPALQPIFAALASCSPLTWPELAKTFNLGVRMEIYCTDVVVPTLLETAASLRVGARHLGQTTAHRNERIRLELTVADQEIEFGT